MRHIQYSCAVLRFKTNATFRRILLATFCIFSTKLQALSVENSQSSLSLIENCHITDSPNSTCVPVFACLGDVGLYFIGRSYGWENGRVEGQLSDGSTCTGTWNKNGLFGTGYSNMSCKNRSGSTLRANVVYYYQDQKTGTVLGRGEDSKGRRIEVWTGRFVLDYLKNQTQNSTNFQITLPCAKGAITVS